MPDTTQTNKIPSQVLNNDILQDEYEPFEKEAEKPKIASFNPEIYYAMISAEVLLPSNDVLVPAIVTGCKCDQDGNPVGVANKNPILDTHVYQVAFPDGHIEEYATNIIAQNIYSQLDAEGQRHQLLEEIVDHHKDISAKPPDQKWIQHGSNKTLTKNTLGWKLKVQWKDQSASWEPLRNLKDPVEVAKYAVAQNIADEIAFAWWVPRVLMQQERMIWSLSTISTTKRNQKYGIEIPINIKRALEINEETNTDYSEKAIAKGMLHVTPAFQILDKGQCAPIGSKWIACYMVFDVKVDFTHKACFVAGGHMTKPPAAITYSSTVARDSIRLAFFIATLNNLDILAADINNACLNGHTKEKVHTNCGLEFGPQFQGHIAVIRRALYGLRT